MTMLGMDTSNQGMVLCLADNKQLIGTYLSANQKNHSTTLMPGIEFLMAENNKKPKDLTSIIVAEGPGSYTGLRIGVTTAKTLAWTLGIDLLAVSSLAVIAASYQEQDGLIIPLINARRGNVYSGAYKWQEGQLIQVIEDQHTELVAWLESLLERKEPIILTGIDVLAFEAEIKELDSPFIQCDLESYNQVLDGRAFLKLDKLAKKVTSIEDFVPNYLKRVEAEEKWLETHQEQAGSSYVERV